MGGFRWRTPPPQGFDHLTNQRPHLTLVYIIHFRPSNPKIFSKAPLAPMYTNFEKKNAFRKKTFCQKFSKSAQKRHFFKLRAKIVSI